MVGPFYLATGGGLSSGVGAPGPPGHAPIAGLFFAWRLLLIWAHVRHSAWAALRGDTCPYGQGIPVKYLVSPKALASFGVFGNFSMATLLPYVPQVVKWRGG